MGTRKVYIDFGTGFEDISDFVKYDTLIITSRCSNDTFHYAQNTASFSTIYDAALYTKFMAAEEDMPVRIVNVIDEACLATENDWFLTTENSFNICTESGVAIPMFYGHIKPTRSRTYNGVIETTIIQFEATDDLNYLDAPIGDIYFADCAVYDATDPANSIIHKLAALRGFAPSQLDPTVSIPTTIQRFAPESEDDSVLSLMDTLLYEFGYTLNMSEGSIITPVKWAVSIGDTPSYTFDEDNIVVDVEVSDSVRDYDGVEITYHELKQANDVLLYMDDNCTYNDDGSFSGYVIPAGYSYPLETNVIDDTTGLDTVVYQEYTEDSINYWTNKAVKENLDYNREAFSSDYSSMVVTENHWLDANYDTGIVPAFAPIFSNKKCQIKYENPTADNALKLWYNNVYGDVWYRGTEKTCTVDLITDPTNVNTYSSQFLFETTLADKLAKALAAMYSIHKTTYTFLSEDRVAEGTYAWIILDDGTTEKCKIQSRKWEEKSELFEYTLIAVSDSVQIITKRTTSVTVTITATDGVITSSLSRTELSVNANADGSNPDLTLANTRMSIYRDGLDVSNGWSYSASITGVTGSFGTGADKNLFTVTGFSSNDTTIGYVTITATRSGWTNQILTFTITKNVIADIGTAVSSYTPKYLGKYLDSIPSSANAGEWYVRYSTTSGDANRGVFLYNGTIWTRTTDSKYIGNGAIVDILAIVAGSTTYGSVADYGATYIADLFSTYIKILTGGAIYGGDRYNADGTDNNTSANGFWLGADGSLKAENGYFTGVLGQERKLTVKDYFLEMFSSNTFSSITKRVVAWGSGIFYYKYNTSTEAWDSMGGLYVTLYRPLQMLYVLMGSGRLTYQ